jgi:hypothetical protein
MEQGESDAQKAEAVSRHAAKGRWGKIGSETPAGPSSSIEPEREVLRGEHARIEETDTLASRTRPTLYSEELAEEILFRIASGQTLSSVCRDIHMPTRSTVTRWLTAACHAPAEFATRFARARDEQLAHWADEIIDVADDSSGDYIDREGRDGALMRVFDAENVHRARLKIDSRKWLLSKLRPGQYGELSRVEVKSEVEVRDSSPLSVIERARRIAYHLQRGADVLAELPAEERARLGEMPLIEGRVLNGRG